MLQSMVPVIKQTSTQWSEAMPLRPGVRRSDGTTGARYQRNPDIQMPGEYDHHVLVAEGVASFAAPALVDIAAQFARP